MRAVDLIQKKRDGGILSRDEIQFFIGGVTSGMLLPMVRGRIDRGTTVVGCTLFSCAGIALLGLTRHWLPAAFGMGTSRAADNPLLWTLRRAAARAARALDLSRV